MNRIGTIKMKTNPLTDALRSGRPSVGSWLSLCSPVAAELMAAVGWDWLVVDAEHSLVGFETLVNCFRAIQLGGAVPLARVPWNETIWIQRTLDAGALGLIVPMVNSVEDARAAVSNMKFATKGQRSFGGSRVSPYLEGDYRAWADANLAVIVMIETVQAVENAEAILAVEGVTAGFIGPVDLALSMGVSPAEMGPGTAHEALLMKALAAARKTGKALGKYCFNAAEVNARIAQGFQLLALFSDAGLLDQAAREAFNAIKRNG
ncbi:MAG TPA: aldolase/citrate lyase family protein [Anaerolineae bacterium]|nr:aldolase/citrate lyase family protein [Anaerolineae bacterium]